MERGQRENRCLKLVQNAMFTQNGEPVRNFITHKNCFEVSDEEFEKNNYCDFKDDICKAKRNCKEKTTMGCCHKFKNRILMSGGLQECPYLINKRCATQCITCKLFTCDAINVKFKLRDIPLIQYFFNPIQKLIVKISFFTKKEEIIKKLVFFSF